MTAASGVILRPPPRWKGLGTDPRSRGLARRSGLTPPGSFGRNSRSFASGLPAITGRARLRSPGRESRLANVPIVPKESHYITVDVHRPWCKLDCGQRERQTMKIIAYYRVSTKRQGRSGLGLDGQRAAVEAFAKRNGGKIVASYTEVESGKRSDRPELAKALGHARLAKATLVVAKLDRLARNVAFLSALMEAGVDFVACDNEHANRLTIHILAAVAESEARAISDRTTAALKAAKKRGIALGSARLGHW